MKKRGSPVIRMLVFLLLPAYFLSGCGFYTFSGNVPGHLESIAIPAVENRTAEFGLVEELTDAIIESFTQDNTLKIRKLQNADCVLYCTLLRLDDKPFSFQANETVDEYKVTLTLKVKFEDRVKGKTVWEETLTQFGVYPFGEGASAREDGIAEAIEKLAEEILNKTVSGW